MELIMLIVGLLVGAALMWYYAEKVKARPGDGKPSEAEAQLTRVNVLLDSVHSLAFGPYGAHPKALDDAFNKLWRFAGLKPEGAPKGE